MTQVFFYLIIGIIIFDAVFQLILDYLNTTRWSEELPAELEGIYDGEKYKKSQAYEKENFKFGLLSSAFSIVLILSLVVFGGFGVLDNWIQGQTDNSIFQALMFFGIILFKEEIMLALEH